MSQLFSHNLALLDLFKSGQFVPLLIAIDESQEPVQASQLLRYIARRRVVVAGKWQGKEVVAKCYYSHCRKAKSHYQRACAGYQALRQAGIPSPVLLHAGQLAGASGHILIFEKIANVITLHADRPSLWLERILPLMALLHDAGLVQSDCHPDNFLLSKDKAWVIDTEGIKKPHTMLTRHCLNNLALLFAQFTELDKAAIARHYAAYCQQRRPAAVMALAQFNRLVAKARAHRLRKIVNKAMRECTAFVQKKNWRMRTVYVREMADRLAAFIAQPESLFDSTSARFLKAGNSASVIEATLGGELVVKRYNIKNHTHAAARALRTTRAQRTWQNAHLLQTLRIPSPEPLVLWEHRFGPLRRSAYVAMTALPGITLMDYLKLHADDVDHALLNTLMQFFKRLYDNRVSHGDCKASNFIVYQKQVYVVDLDAMRMHRSRLLFHRAFRRDLRRFIINFTTYPLWHEAVKKQFDCVLSD